MAAVLFESYLCRNCTLSFPQSARGLQDIYWVCHIAHAGFCDIKLRNILFLAFIFNEIIFVWGAKYRKKFPPYGLDVWLHYAMLLLKTYHTNPYFLDFDSLSQTFLHNL